MLTAYQIDALRDKSTQLLDPIIDFLIEDIAKRVSEAGQLTGTASYQVWRLQKLGVSQREIKKEIQKRLKVSQREVEQLLTQAAETGYNFDLSRFPNKRATPFVANTSIQQILDTAVKMAQEDLLNITQTIGFICPDGEARPLTKAYQSACDFAFTKVATGAQDFYSAVRDATRGLAEKGILSIDYESGVHTSLEAAVRRNIMGGLGLMQEQIHQQNHDDLGCNGWEITAHEGSAPDHEPIQGKQYPDEVYKRLNNSLKRRIATLNCGHDAFGIIIGVNAPQYTPEELEGMRRRNEEGITYNGKHYTLDKARQHQRGLERAARKQKRRILIDEAAGDTEKLQQDQIKLVRIRQEYKRFSDAAGLRMQHERMNTAGFTWKHAKSAESSYRKRVEEVGEGAVAQNWHTIPVAGGKIDTKYRRIKHVVTDNDPANDAANRIINDNVARTNPAYRNGNPAYTQNCQRCVATYEMRRRGYDVIAKPAVVDENHKLSVKDPIYASWKNIFEGAKFEMHTGFDGGKASIIEQMDVWGDGSVAEVRVLWKTSGAHVFIAERVNGKVRFVDPQSGNINCEYYFTDAIVGATMIARIDHLQPTALIAECIKNRGGKR